MFSARTDTPALSWVIREISIGMFEKFGIPVWPLFRDWLEFKPIKTLMMNF
ncbi:hypothetical protein SFMTTN_0885 [Sulfuriferula multivorans]|uniref:Uncharacterized protein n=1 Tax=Sulfuriferula multivorans TaxID=1559896 RepID=A0A401JBP6_9PROT|nr:hypothetical protein SFMTTN_0885 [Sulfuriferula multivorans]